MEIIWHQYLYRPLLNALIFLYNNYTAFNMGLAVIYLTILLRILLLPLTIFSEKSKGFYQELSENIKEIQKDFPNDVVRQKEEVKAILRKKRFFPWAKFVSLAIQLLVLVLLYQVFLGGINAKEKFDLLYSFVARPDFINTKFFWFDIGQRNALISGIVAVVLFIEISFLQHRKQNSLSKRDFAFRIFFPVVTFFILYALSSVKSIFVLTSLLFSAIIMVIQQIVWKLIGTKKSAKKEDKKKEKKEETDDQGFEQSPWERLKK